MAQSGTVKTASIDGGTYFFVEWELKSQDKADNTSKISFNYGVYSAHTYYTNAIKISDCTIAGKTCDGATYSNIGTGKHILKSGTRTITHNADGTKSFTIGQFRGYAYGAGWTSYTSSTSFTLPKITRAASISTAPNFTLNDSPTIKYSNPFGDNVDSLQVTLAFTNSSSDTGWKDVSKTGTSYTFNFTTTERAQLETFLSSSKSKTVYFRIKTVIDGSTYYDTVSKTLTAGDAAAPNLNPTVTVDSNTRTYTGRSDKIICGYTTVTYSANASGKNGAQITICSLSNGNKKYNGQAGTINGVIDGAFDFYVEDSRGLTNAKSIVYDEVEYFQPTISYTIEPPSATGRANISVEGKVFNGSFGAYTNSLNVYYCYSKNGGSFSSWYSLGTPTKSGNTYSLDTTITGLDYSASYEFKLKVVDSLSTVTSGSQSVTGEPIFIIKEDEVDFNVDVYIDGHKVTPSVTPADYVVETGTSNSWTYQKWNSGKMEAWKTITANTVSFASSLGSYMHYTKGDSNWLLPTGFRAAPIVTINCTMNYLILAQAVSVTSTKFNINWTRFVNSSSPSLSNVPADCYAVGKWK